MYKKVVLLLFTMLLTICPAYGRANQAAFALNTSYTATLKYYDNVQITYTLTYPSGEVWSTAGDIPIGGTEISDQIYCADPFAIFHSRVDNSSWNGYATVDIKDSYVVAAPWAISGAVKQNSEAIKWLVLNGYRGDYLAANDTESNTSVSRLQELYPSLMTDIDKQVALMATKVALWKVIAGDSVTVVKTSLDNNSAKKNAFTNLIEALINDATSVPPREVISIKSSDFLLTVDNSRIPASLTTIDSYTYYGPLTVKAELYEINTEIVTPQPLVDKVFLTLSGQELDDISFVDSNTASAQLLSSNAMIYGTITPAQYLEGGDFILSGRGGEWESQEFYLKIPSMRNEPNLPEDHLIINAMAMSDNVPLQTGTPLTFILENDSGIQDWNAIQAFVGGAKEGLLSNMYAEAKLNTGEHKLGEIQISKQVIDGNTLETEALFTFRIYSSLTANIEDSTPLELKAEYITGAYSIDFDSFELKNGSLSTIYALPATDSSGDNYYYWVEEYPLSGYKTPSFQINANISDSGVGNIAGPFQIDDFGMGKVLFINEQERPKTYLDVSKALLKYLADGSRPRLATGESFNFFIEFSDDEGITWQPFPLDDIFKSGIENLTDAQNGKFSLKSIENHNIHSVTDAALIELDYHYMYRITELEPFEPFVPVYSLAQYHGNSDTGWNIVDTEKISYHDDENWTDPATPYTMEGFSVVEGDYYFIKFINIDATFCKLSVEKTVTGEETAKDKLFPFTVYFMNEYNPALPAPWPIAVSVDGSNDTAIISGITEDRIENDSVSGRPVIFYLKNGETATLENMPAGDYKVCELLHEGYSVYYSIEPGNGQSVNEAETAVFNIRSDTKVIFNNKAPDPQGTDDKENKNTDTDTDKKNPAKTETDDKELHNDAKDKSSDKTDTTSQTSLTEEDTIISVSVEEYINTSVTQENIQASTTQEDLYNADDSDIPKGKADGEEENIAIPQTKDNSHPVFFSAALIISIGFLAKISFYRKRKKTLTNP
ncbi:MAG: Cys-Gln thioester bond-forming surface protein [Firmicutes bacterium]|nr:Cys-Gln thioester bond-forming surface protein [Bacillota bacterium]